MKVGLCSSCIHARITGNLRGSIFILCTAHKEQPELPKYPVLPVFECFAYKREDHTSVGRDEEVFPDLPELPDI
jgi:hypothetical protein